MRADVLMCDDGILQLSFSLRLALLPITERWIKKLLPTYKALALCRPEVEVFLNDRIECNNLQQYVDVTMEYVKQDYEIREPLREMLDKFRGAIS